MRVVAPDTLAIYIHWPFCLKKCPYCDFNSHGRERVEQDAWREALLTEIAHYAKLCPDRRITSIFFGGGTPSLMPPETVHALLESIAQHWPLDDNIENHPGGQPHLQRSRKFQSTCQSGHQPCVPWRAIFTTRNTCFPWSRTLGARSVRCRENGRRTFSPLLV